MSKLPKHEQELGITGCEAPCGGHPLRELKDLQKAYETEATDYFEMLDWVYEQYKSPEITQELPVARIHKVPWKKQK